MVDVDDGATEADLLQGIGQDVDGFSVGERRVGTDDIGVALPELAEPATLRLLGPPDGSDVIPLEGHHQVVLVHGDDTGQWHGEVVAEPDLTITLVPEVVHELLVLAGLASEDLHVLQRRGVERLEAVLLEDRANDVQDLLPEHHVLGQVVPKPFEDLRFAW